MTQLYIPPNATNKIEEEGNIFLGIQGPSGSGKTASTLTFPNPIYALFDRPDLAGIRTLPHLKDTPEPYIYKFYSADFVVNTLKCPIAPHGVIDRRAAYRMFLKTEATKLTKEQTLVTDTWTGLQDCFDEINWKEPRYTKDGKIDDFAFWDAKIEYAEEIHTLLKALKCNVVVTFHEMPERDKITGKILDKIQPLMQGKFICKLKSYYPNFFRQRNRQIRDDKGNPIEGKREFLWQTQSSDDFDAKCSKPLLPTYVPADYNSLISH